MNGTQGSISKRKVAVELAIVGVLVVLLAALGPFGTYAMPAGQRAVLWTLFVVGGYAFFRPIIAGGDALSAQSGMPRWAAIAAACLLASLPTTLLVQWLLAGRSIRNVSIGSLAALYPQVLVVGATVTAVQLIVSARRPPGSPELPDAGPAEEAPAAAAGQTAHAPVARSALIDRLPPHLGDDLVCLQNEDHYVRVHTALGNTLILMRMGDAVALLNGEDGMRVHRGWWVKRAAVASIERRNRSVFLHLANGLEVPAARAAIPALREAGWLDVQG